MAQKLSTILKNGTLLSQIIDARHDRCKYSLIEAPGGLVYAISDLGSGILITAVPLGPPLALLIEKIRDYSKANIIYTIKPEAKTDKESSTEENPDDEDN